MNLAGKLSLNIKFQANKTEAQAIGYATRAWRELTDQDVKVLLGAIIAEKESTRPVSPFSSEEVAETSEKEIEQYIKNKPTLLGEDLKVYSQQKSIGEGRLDLLLENSQGDWFVVEVKYNRIGRGALQQIRTYIHDLEEETKKKVSGVIVCAGVMPAFEEEIKAQKDIQVFVYGWDLRVEKWGNS